MTGVAEQSRVLLTSDVDAFIEELRDGDVLLFNSLHEFSHAIKLIDNSPVNHCALYKREGEEMVNAGLPKRNASGRVVVPCVRAEPLRVRLESHTDRTVTAFRLGDQDISDAAVEEAIAWTKLASRYGFMDVLGLAADCIQRSYGARLGRAEKVALHAVAATLRVLSEGPVRQKGAMTCSAFVYSCYTIAEEGCIRISDPLAVWSEGRQTHLFRRGSGKRSLHPADIAFREADDEDDASVQLHASSAGRDEWETILAYERRELREVVAEHHELAREPDQTSRNIALAETSEGKVAPHDLPNAPVAITVTPFDFWQSPSLRPVCALHRPPHPKDPVYTRLGGVTPQ